MNPKALDSWITSITDLHRDKPPQNIQYTTAMPDIELLMQEWPDDVTGTRAGGRLPSRAPPTGSRANCQPRSSCSPNHADGRDRKKRGFVSF